MNSRSPEFKAWFAGSRCIGLDGQPLVLFHGTATDFDVVFRVNDGNEMRGIFFTDSKQEALDWGDRRNGGVVVIKEAILKITRPAELADLQEVQASLRARNRIPSAEAVTKALIRRGFDGYIDDSNSGNAREFVVFKANQICNP